MQKRLEARSAVAWAVLFAVVLAGAVPLFTDENAVTQVTGQSHGLVCHDSDQGLNFEKAGYVQTRFGTYQDTCSSTRGLIEYECLRGEKNQVYKSCHYGCQNNACLTATPDKDEGEWWEKRGADVSWFPLT